MSTAPDIDALTTSFGVLSINTDWSNRLAEARGKLLPRAVVATMQSEQSPGLVVLQEIGPRNADSVLRAVKQHNPSYSGVHAKIDKYSCGAILYDTDKWQRIRNTQLLVNSDLSHVGVALQNKRHEDLTLLLFNVHMPYKSSYNTRRSVHREFAELMSEHYRREHYSVVTSVGDQNATPSEILDIYEDEGALAAFFDDDVDEWHTTGAGCKDNAIKLSRGRFDRERVLHECTAWTHKPIYVRVKAPVGVVE